MKVLVTAASKHGATDEIAEAIARVLGEAGIATEVVPPGRVKELRDFDAVILGSGIYAGHWLEAAKAFVERHEQELLDRKVWLFSCGPLGTPPKPTGEPFDVLSMAEATGAVDHRTFPGRLARDRLSIPERVVVAALRAPYGDFRSFDEIEAWARGIAAELGTPSTVAKIPSAPSR